jgi:hypothetical protein
MVVAFAARRVKKRASTAVIRCWITFVCFWIAAGLARADVPRSEGRGFKGASALARARVVVVEDPRSVVAFSPSAEVVQAMMNGGLMALTSKDTPERAWRSLVTTQDVIGIKVFSSPGASSGTRPVVVNAMVKSMFSAGIPPKQIVIWDKWLADLRMAGFVELGERLGVQVLGSADEGYDGKVFYETPLLGNLVWGDYEFGKKGDNLGRRSYVSRLLTQRLTKIVNVTPMLNHNLALVSGNLYSLAFGSVDNTIRFESSPSQMAQAIPEIYALPEVGDRVVLNVVDALICQYQGEERTLLHYSTMLHQLRFSTDPVALDVLSVHELDRQRQLARTPPVRISWQTYTNASLLELGVSDPRSIDLIKVTPRGSDSE